MIFDTKVCQFSVEENVEKNVNKEKSLKYSVLRSN